jgi:hypothetical protein
MAFKFPVRDWWTPLGWKAAPEGSQCCICDAVFGVAEAPFKEFLCEFHSKCTLTGITTILYSKRHNRKIPLEQWMDLSLNSYDRDSLIQYQSNEVLVYNVELCLKNTQRFDPPASTYDEAIQLYAREMSKRLSEEKL